MQTPTSIALHLFAVLAIYFAKNTAISNQMLALSKTYCSRICIMQSVWSRVSVNFNTYFSSLRYNSVWLTFIRSSLTVL